jgi:hypothetical protein
VEAVLVVMTLPTVATLSEETSSLAATPAALVSEEMSILPPTLAATPTDPPTPIETPTALPTPTEIPMAHPTLAETTSLPQTTTTVPATLAALATDQTRPKSLDTTTNLPVNLLAMMT